MVWSVFLVLLSFVPKFDGATTVGHGTVTVAGESDVVSFDVTGVAGQTALLLNVQDNGGTNTLTFSVGGALAISGALSKGSGTFDIPHPISILGAAGWRLRHSFVEAPRAENIYTLVVPLNATAEVTVDVDIAFAMSPGTFGALNRDPRILATGNGCTVRWSFAVPPVLHLTGARTGEPWLCQPHDNITVLLVAERHDPNIRTADFTDNDGRVVPEYRREDHPISS